MRRRTRLLKRSVLHGRFCPVKSSLFSVNVSGNKLDLLQCKLYYNLCCFVNVLARTVILLLINSTPQYFALLLLAFLEHCTSINGGTRTIKHTWNNTEVTFFNESSKI